MIRLRLEGAARALVCSALCIAASAWGQKLADRPIRLVTASSPGSATDLAARAVSESLSAALGVPVIVDNRPGGQGRIAQTFVLGAPPDGHTLYTFSSADATLPTLNKDYPFDPVKSFAAIAPLATSPNVLVVAPATGFKTLQSLVDAAKANPDALAYGSVGVGSASFMNAEMFRRSAGIKLLHVPFKGGGEATNEVLAGRVTLFFGSVATVQQHIKAGKLTALAVGTNTRVPQLPEVPTLAEAGTPNADYLFWIGLVASSKTPEPLLNLLAEGARKASADPRTRQRLDELGYQNLTMTRPQFATFIASEVARSATIIRESGVKIE